MTDYIKREAFLDAIERMKPCYQEADDIAEMLQNFPAADVVEEENILKFYYVRSIDEYWIGQRIDNFYYAEYDFKIHQWVWTHSRYLPWGEHVISPTSAWKEHTYPSEPEEIPFEDWLQGFIKKYITAADVRPVVLCRDCKYARMTIDGLCKYCDRLTEIGVDDAVYLPGDFFCAAGEKREES